MPNEKQMGSKTGGTNIEPATGKLGIMVVGLGAVATTMTSAITRAASQRNTLRPRRTSRCTSPSKRLLHTLLSRHHPRAPDLRVRSNSGGTSAVTEYHQS